MLLPETSLCPKRIILNYVAAYNKVQVNADEPKSPLI